MNLLHQIFGRVTRKITIAIAVLIFTISINVWAGQPTDQLKDTLDRMVNVLNDPTLKAKDRIQEKRKALHEILKCRFDEEALAERALGNQWNKISPEEKKAFIKVFISLLEQTYFDKIDAQLASSGEITSENIHYNKELIKGEYAQIETQITAGEDAPIPVIYRLKNLKGDWRVVDMAIEGVIITKNYRAQFDEILARNSFDELIRKLETKLAVE